MIQRKNICASIVDDVIERIKNKELKPGDKLPNEQDMADQFGVSRISLREALRYLSAKGLVVTKHGEGSFINEYDPDMIAETFFVFSLLTDNPMTEMIELRKVMEAQSARLCAMNATEEEIAQILEYKNKREEACLGDDYETRFENDRLFHLAIAKASHNNIFYKFIETIHLTIELHQKEYTKNTESVQCTTKYHNEIFKGIENRDADAAYKAMYDHLDEIEKNIDL